MEEKTFLKLVMAAAEPSYCNAQLSLFLCNFFNVKLVLAKLVFVLGASVLHVGAGRLNL